LGYTKGCVFHDIPRGNTNIEYYKYFGAEKYCHDCKHGDFDKAGIMVRCKSPNAALCTAFALSIGQRPYFEVKEKEPEYENL
jgi:hypothetical protein